MHRSIRYSKLSLDIQIKESDERKVWFFSLSSYHISINFLNTL